MSPNATLEHTEYSHQRRAVPACPPATEHRGRVEIELSQRAVEMLDVLNRLMSTSAVVAVSK